MNPDEDRNRQEEKVQRRMVVIVADLRRLRLAGVVIAARELQVFAGGFIETRDKMDEALSYHRIPISEFTMEERKFAASAIVDMTRARILRRTCEEGLEELRLLGWEEADDGAA